MAKLCGAGPDEVRIGIQFPLRVLKQGEHTRSAFS